jgi:hypothetical protein
MMKADHLEYGFVKEEDQSNIDFEDQIRDIETFI